MTEIPDDVAKAAAAISKAKSQLVLRQPFYGALALRLRTVPSRKIETMGVDGRSLFYNPAWVNSLPFKHLVGVVAHEVTHCALGHPWRRGARDPKLWNIAADRVVNRMLATTFELPDNRHQAPDQPDTSVEEEYAVLRDMQPPAGGGSEEGEAQPGASGAEHGGEPESHDDEPEDDASDEPKADAGDAPGKTSGDCGGCGEVMDYPVDRSDPIGAKAEMERSEREFQVAVVQAAQSAKGFGNLPLGIEQAIEAALKPQIPWTKVTRRYMREVSKDDFSWRRPNKRLLSQDVYAPGRHNVKIGGVVVAVDMSGSTLGMRGHFFGELEGIINEIKPPWVEVIYCDSAVAGVERFKKGQKFDPHPVGGGGTSFSPVWDSIKKRGVRPVCAIYLTDLEGGQPTTSNPVYGDAPPFPVIWVTTKLEAAPYGRVLRLDTTMRAARS